MVDRVKLGHKLAFLVVHDHLSVFGLELLADCFNVREIQDLGRHVAEARKILEQPILAKRIQDNLWKFTRPGESDASVPPQG